VKVFWGLDDRLAQRKHFPAINWLLSYSLYTSRLDPYYEEKLGEDFPGNRARAMAILQEEAELEEIVRLVGIDALSPRQRLVMETAKSIREDFLYQSAFHEVDTYCSLAKQHLLLRVILSFCDRALEALDEGASLDDLLELPVREQIARARYTPEDELQRLRELEAEVASQVAGLRRKT
jgi:V/A-type H+-transporting ATPase subunit A